jgi:ACR3 family arsenite efflux pump ArsB
MNITKKALEENQIWIYAIIFPFSLCIGYLWEHSPALTSLIEPVIGLLLYSMFCQIPFLELKKTLKDKSFFKALLLGNFIFIPILVYSLSLIFLIDPVLILGVFLVLLTPCIDYVIVFTHLGKGNSQSILSATPLLFVLQMLLLPLYFFLFMGADSLSILEVRPFVDAFLYMIVIPFILAILTQIYSKPKSLIKKVLNISAWLPVPFMALTLFVVLASQITILTNNLTSIFIVLPIYILFHLIAPYIGILSSKIFKVNSSNTRTIAFSVSTRNSLVVLPMALALPAPTNLIVAAVIVTQTVVELSFQLIYIKVIPLAIQK